MIPKKIHYCWFGGAPLPPLAEKCIASWRKLCPDYEIIRWDENNFDVNCCQYVKEAYDAKKWAFVSDYARFWVLYRQGGVYLDTDVELLKPLDAILDAGGFMGLQADEKPEVAPGLGMACPAGTALMGQLLECYHSRRFLNDDGTLNQATVVDYTTEYLTRYGLTVSEKVQEVAGILVYPKEYFCPMDYATGKLNITPNTYAIHHYSASWHDEKEQYAFRLQRKYTKVLSKRAAAALGTLTATCRYEGIGTGIKWLFKRR